MNAQMICAIPRVSVNKFSFDGRKERLGAGVIEANPASAHGLADLVHATHQPVFVGGVLRPTVRVKDQTDGHAATAAVHGCVESVGDELGAHVIREGPSDELLVAASMTVAKYQNRSLIQM
jgi:hypothetical protein